MTDTIETVARAMADSLALDWDGKANGTEYANHGYWLPLSQAAITAHTAALIAGAGEQLRCVRSVALERESGILLWTPYDQAAATIAALQARAEAAEAECLEQARLLGMSGERELALRAELERLTAQLAEARESERAALVAKQAVLDKIDDVVRSFSDGDGYFLASQIRAHLAAMGEPA